MSFSKVEVRSQHELLRIEELLDAAADSWLQARAGQVPEELAAALKAANASAFAQLKHFVTVGGEESGQENLRQGTPSHMAAKSPLLKPLSPPPVDGEVCRLEAEVNEASARVAELRTSMQARLQEELGARLARCRPTAAIDGSEPAAEAEEEGGGAAGGAPEAMAVDGGPAALEPAPQSMQAQLEAAAAKMPAVRAQLEAADERLRRVVAAVTAEVNRPAPNTVERAVAGKTPLPSEGGAEGAGAAPGGEGADGAAPAGSPDLTAVLEAGQLSTRRRVARDVRPVPFPAVADDAPPA